MCLNPIPVKSYEHGNALRAAFPFLIRGSTYAPCGVCPECLYKKQQFIIQRCEMMYKSHDVFFCTLTYNNIHLPTINISGFTHHYVDIKHVQDFLKRIRKHNVFPLPFKYMYVTEYGSVRHRPHVHMLFFVEKPEYHYHTDVFANPDYPDYFARYDTRNDYLESLAQKLRMKVLNEWCVNVGTRKNPKYSPLCTYVNTIHGRNYDFHAVIPYRDAKDDPNHVIYYVTKYMLKIDKWNEKRLSAISLDDSISDNDRKKYLLLLRNRRFFSKGFGINDYTPEHIRTCIDKSLTTAINGYFNYYSSDGKSSCLSPYYRHRYVTISDATRMYFRNKQLNNDNVILSPLDDTRSYPPDVIARYKRRVKTIQEKIQDVDENLF